MMESIETAFRAALARRPLSRAEASGLIPCLAGNLQEIMGAALASGVPPFFSCGIVNAKSGRCAEDCSFCAQSRYHKTNAPVYALLAADILYDRAVTLAASGVRRMGIVTSGTAPSGRDFENICRAARRIAESVEIKLCASLGALSAEQAAMLRDAGITSYHHNLETGRSFYPAVCTTHGWESRVATVQNALAAGLRVCSGGLFGLGETWDQRLELAETLQELDVDSIPVNFLMAVAGTPLEGKPGLSPAEALGLIAIFRLMHPDRDIVLCGGRGKTLGEWDRVAVLAGANGIMVGDYLTARGNPLDRDLRLLRDLEAFRRA